MPENKKEAHKKNQAASKRRSTQGNRGVEPQKKRQTERSILADGSTQRYKHVMTPIITNY